MHRGLRSRPVQHRDLGRHGARQRGERYLNATEGADRDKALCYGVAKDIVSVLAPICPFWADELWHEALGCEGNAYTAAWPEFDLAESIEDTVQIVVQVLGKVRGRIDVARDASNEEMQLPPRLLSPSGSRARRSSRPSACPASWSTWWLSKHCVHS